jgi:hypothetical protein
MPGRSNVKPCSSCGKPLKTAAPKCWFCGAVFDTQPCPVCGRPLKNDSTHCQFCGEDMPPAALPYVPSDADSERGSREPVDRIAARPIPQERDESETPTTRECPSCGEEITRAAVTCKHCGVTVSRRLDHGDWGRGGSHRPHRAATILWLAVVSYFVCTPLAVLALVMAIRDVREMRAGRMDPSGEALTWVGLVLAAFPTMLLAGVIFFLVVSGLSRG